MQPQVTVRPASGTLLISSSHTQELGPASAWSHAGSAYLGMTVGSVTGSAAYLMFTAQSADGLEQSNMAALREPHGWN